MKQKVKSEISDSAAKTLKLQTKCVLATVAAVILISSPTVSVQYKDIGGVVIDKQHAMIAAVAAVLSGIAAFAVRHHQEF